MKPIRSLLMILLLAAPLHAATIEFLSGTKLECKVLKKDDVSVTVEVSKEGKKETRTFKLSTVHKVVINDKTYLINEKAKANGGTKNNQGDTSEGTIKRTKAEVESLIEQQGRQPAEWFEATPLDYPESLDLSWPEPAPGGWDNQKNMGQYIWDVINPNPGKWRAAIRLMHHLLQMHQDDVAKRKRVMSTMGEMYHHLHQDYARAAFWLRQAGVDKGRAYGPRARLAECYVRLGNKQMALDLVGKDPVTAMKVKLYADLGDLKQAGQWAEKFNETNGGDFAYLAVADGYRSQGKNKEALNWYEKAVALCNKPTFKGRCKNRAESSLEAIKLAELADVSRVADGMHTGEALGYEGPIHVAVTVKGKRIEDVKITQHKEKQFYSSLTDTPAQIIAKQGVKGVDTTTHATITSVAIINATAKALASGAK
jgi:uncharacterized protein with FMN-binding domain